VGELGGTRYANPPWKTRGRGYPRRKKETNKGGSANSPGEQNKDLDTWLCKKTYNSIGRGGGVKKKKKKKTGRKKGGKRMERGRDESPPLPHHDRFGAGWSEGSFLKLIKDWRFAVRSKQERGLWEAPGWDINPGTALLVKRTTLKKALVTRKTRKKEPRAHNCPHTKGKKK